MAATVTAPSKVLSIKDPSVIKKLNQQRRNYANQKWRLNNLYKIKDKEGHVVQFIMNEQQENLYDNQWYLNVVLKARQLGFSTFIDVYILDTCLFNDNIDAGIIAHHLDDAKTIFDDKIKFPYDSLPEWVRGQKEATTDRANEIAFSNGSRIRVSTSFRSGTLQILHVSEYGKIAAKFPDKAREIKTGAFESVATGQKIFVESTAEGRDGEFYELCVRSQAATKSNKKLSPLDFRFHFYPWWKNPLYRLDPAGVVITQDDAKYFENLAERGIKLDDGQCAWWAKKFQTLGVDIWKEHPSYPEEAFKASIDGAYYGTVMTGLRQKDRIGNVPWEQSFPVHTAWDLGMNDAMSIVFFQQIVKDVRIIDFIQDQDRGIPYYAKLLKEKPYSYGNHYMPHDIKVRDLSTDMERRIDVARKHGIVPIVEVAKPRNNQDLMDQIDMTRKFLSMAWIDESNCSHVIKALEAYSKEWDEKLGTFKSNPRHNWASHPADAVRSGAVGFKSVVYAAQQMLEPPPLEDY